MAEYKLFTVCDADGNVIRSGSCPETDLNLQADDQQSEALLVGVAADSRLHKVDLETMEVVDIAPVAKRGTLNTPDNPDVPSTDDFTKADLAKELLQRVIALESQVAQLLAQQSKG